MEERRAPKSVLGKEWQINGELSIDQDAVIEGQVTGVLRSQGTLELGESARVSGTIVGDAVRVAGQVEADIVGQQEVELLPGAKMRGRVFSHRFTVQEGAGFRGEIWIDDDAMDVAAKEVLSQVDAAGAVTSNGRDSREHDDRNGDDLSSQELAMLTDKGEQRHGSPQRPLRRQPLGNGR